MCPTSQFTSAFPCLLKRMVLPIIMNAKNNMKRKCSNLLNFVTFKELSGKHTFLKIAAQALEAGDFFNISLGFCGSFFYKKNSYWKNVYYNLCGRSFQEVFCHVIISPKLSLVLRNQVR